MVELELEPFIRLLLGLIQERKSPAQVHVFAGRERGAIPHLRVSFGEIMRHGKDARFPICGNQSGGRRNLNEGRVSKETHAVVFFVGPVFDGIVGPGSCRAGNRLVIHEVWRQSLIEGDAIAGVSQHAKTCRLENIGRQIPRLPRLGGPGHIGLEAHGDGVGGRPSLLADITCIDRQVAGGQQEGECEGYEKPLEH